MDKTHKIQNSLQRALQLCSQRGYGVSSNSCRGYKGRRGRKIIDTKRSLHSVKGTDSNLIVKHVGEAAFNVLRGNVPLNQRRLKQLDKHRKLLKSLSNKKISLKQKKKILNQKGGAILPLLLPPVLTFLAKVAADKLSRK